MVSATAAQEFLSQHRIAVIGVSRDSRQFANAVFRTLRERGYEVIPVNPHAGELEGVTAYPSLQATSGPVDGALVLLPKAAHLAAVDDCLAAGVSRIWFQSPAGAGTSPEVAARAREAGATVIDGGCPYMFLQKPGWFHSCHTAIARWTGSIQP
ncbi:MAG: CoA-binding protein [Bacillota bacterium]